MPIITDYLLGTSRLHWCEFVGHETTRRDIQQIGAALMVNHSHLAIEGAIDSQGVTLVSDILATDTIMSGQLVPLTDRWPATGNGYHIGSGAGRPRRDVDEFAG